MTDHCIANSLLFFFRTCKERKSIEVLQSLWIIANVPIQLCLYRHRSPNQKLQTKSFWEMMIFLGRSILRLFFFRRLDNFLSLASIWSNFVTLNFWWDTMSRHFVRRCQDSKKGIIYFNRSNMTKHRRFDHQQVSIDFGMLFLCK